MNSSNIVYKKISEISNLKRGIVISKDFINENKGFYPVYSSQTSMDGNIGSINSYNFDGEYLTWTTDGANAGTIFYRKGKFNITNVCGLIDADKNIVITKYLYYILSINSKKHVRSGIAIPKLMSNVMADITVPIPPIEKQKEIVKILDKFESLTNDLVEGLPKEIELVQKQYEYYREKLLTFN